MPWRAFSRTDSRRSKSLSSITEPRDFRGRLLTVAALIVALSVVSVEADAEELELHAAGAGSGRLTLEVHGAPTDRIASALSERMRSRLELVLRAFERADGLTGLLGDRLLAEQRVTKTAYYDPFTENYVVETTRSSGNGGTDDASTARRHVGPDVETAVGELLSLADVAVPAEVLEPARERYLMAQVRLRPLMLAERLRILSLVIPKYTIRSAWTPIEGPR
jgi:hypothetical protein